MLRRLRENWMLITAAVAVIVWLVRLEARSQSAASNVDQAVTRTQVEEIGKRLDRIEGKVDRLLERR